MSERELRAAIDSLVREIDAIDDSDAASREQLAALAGMLSDRLERSRASDANAEEPVDTDDTSDNALLEMVSSYEARHPKLTTMVNDIMVRLASMGI